MESGHVALGGTWIITIIKENIMKQVIIYFIALAAFLAVVPISEADHETAKPAVLYISDNEQIKLARSAAPPSISDDATIIIVNWDGKFKTVVTGTLVDLLAF